VAEADLPPYVPSGETLEEFNNKVDELAEISARVRGNTLDKFKDSLKEKYDVIN